MLSTNLPLQVAPAIVLDVHSGVDMCKSKLVAYSQYILYIYAHGGSASTSYKIVKWLAVLYH